MSWYVRAIAEGGGEAVFQHFAPDTKNQKKKRGDVEISALGVK